MNQPAHVNRKLGYGSAWALLLAGSFVSASAAAQTAPTAVPTAAAASAAAKANPTAAPPAPAASNAPKADEAPKAPANTEEKPDLVAMELASRPGGMTLDEAARLAQKSNTSIRAKQADLRAAAAKVDQAMVNYLPRVSLSFTYTRLSPVGNSLGGGGALLGVQTVGAPITVDGQEVPTPITTGPCPGFAAAECLYSDPTKSGAPVEEASKYIVAPVKLDFPVLENSYSFVASLAVPVSDYVLRISQGHAAASHAEKAKQIEVEAEKLAVAADAKVAFLNFVRAKGQVIVAKQAVAQAKAHVADAKLVKEAGLLSQADILRAEAQVAAAEQLQAETEAFASIAEEQVRIGLGLDKTKSITIGFDLLAITPPDPLPSLQTYQDSALENRLEIRALDETVLSLKNVDSVTRAGLLPRVDAFADLTVANPNQRVFPQSDKFDTTWDAGIRVSWTINDTLTTIGAAAESKARIDQITEQKNTLRNGLRLEVAAAYADVKKSGPALKAASQGLTASEESLRVRREEFLLGKAKTTDMIDAETEVTRARLRKLDAHVSLAVAKVKLDHASGADVGNAKVPAAEAPKDTKEEAPNGSKLEVGAPKADVATAPKPILPLAQ